MPSRCDSGPKLRYTNELAREMEKKVEAFARLVNDDLYDLLKWAERQRQALAKADAEVTVLADALRGAGVAPTLVQKMIDEAKPR